MRDLHNISVHRVGVTALRENESDLQVETSFYCDCGHCDFIDTNSFDYSSMHQGNLVTWALFKCPMFFCIMIIFCLCTMVMDLFNKFIIIIIVLIIPCVFYNPRKVDSFRVIYMTAQLISIMLSKELLKLDDNA
ncbi:Protein of unknown function, partial [Gryllus bimaculatus]